MYKATRLTSFFEKLLLTLSPIAWGFLTWYLNGTGLLPAYPLNLIVYALIVIAVYSYFYKDLYDHLQQTARIYFFNYPLPLPAWRTLVIFMFLMLFVGLLFSPLYDYPLIESLIVGVTFYPIIEEILAHTFFIKFRFSIPELLFWALLNSFAFMLMHRWYHIPLAPLSTLWHNGHFQFGFAMALLAYITRRIETSIIIHMLSNLMRYTVPFVIIGKKSYGYSLFIDILYFICLIGLCYRKIIQTRVRKNG